MVLLLSSLSIALLSLVIGLALFFLHLRFTYWERRGLVHDKPVWFFGNLKTMGRTTTIREPIRDFYNKYKGKSRLGGFYLLMRRAVVPLDLDLVKSVMVKDFTNFADRGNYYNEKDDPLSAHLFNLDGRKWREMRHKLTPTFTSLKMHQMLPIVVEIAQRMVDQIRQEVATSRVVQSEESPIEVKELLARFTTDVIGSCAFGLDCNSLKDPEAEFRVVGRTVFSKRRHGLFIFSFLQAFPNLGRALHMKLVTDYASEFYIRVVRQTMEFREKNNVQRNDFFNLLMELRKEAGGIMSFNEIAAQAFVFLLAGFETSSSTLGFALYQLTKNPDVQEKARAEIQSVFKKHREFTYEAMKDLKYLKQVLYETLRIYSIAPLILRKAINDYPVPGTSHIIEAGTTVIIPVDAIHYDPDIYPDPQRFDPDRFTPEAIEQRHPMAWLPFGTGPRNCIGLRFAEMQTLIGLAMLLNNFNVSKAKATQDPIEIDKKSAILSSKGGIIVNVQELDNK